MSMSTIDIQKVIIMAIETYAVISAIKSCWLKPSEMWPTYITFTYKIFFHSKYCICYNEVVIITLNICRLK